MTELLSVRRMYLAAVVAFLVGGLSYSSVVHSPTIDETAHLPAGLSHWELGRFELYAVNPPLVRMMASLPVTFFNPEVSWQQYSRHIAGRSEFKVGRDLVGRNGSRTIRLYAIARLALLPISLCGGFLCLVWGRVLTGTVAGIVAATLFCVSPTVLANASMITPDVGSAVFGGWALYRISRWDRSHGWDDAVSAGLLLGLALLTKFTCLFLCASLAVALVSFGRVCKEKPQSFRKPILQSVIIGMLAIYIVNVGYCFDGSGTRLGQFSFVSNDLKRSDDRAKGNRFAGTPLAMIPVPLPRCYVLGIDTQKRDFERGYRSYLMGEWKHGGWWYYYLVGFLVKEPIGFQLLLYVSILHGLWNWKRWTPQSIREWSFIVVPPLLIFSLVSSQTGFNHHMRYVLPAYPFLFIIAARTVTLGRFWKWFSYAMLTWQAAAVLWFAPHWMSYFNEAAGGPKNGHAWLVDSNIDWGQDILMLKWWQDEHPEVEELHSAVFTMFDPADIGLKYKLPPPYIAGRPDIVDQDGRRGPQPGWYADQRLSVERSQLFRSGR